MEVIKNNDMGFLWKAFEHKRKALLSIALLGGFTLTDRPEPVAEKDIWDAAAAEIEKGAVMDEGYPKPRGEVLVAGRCYPEGGGARKAGEVSFRVGSVSKRLTVFGPREWTRRAGVVDVIGEPAPFTYMPVTWQRAYGGSNFNKNPLGLGLGPAKNQHGEIIHPLPNIENPARLIASPDDRPEPAGCGPMEAHWPQRAKKAGTYDNQWKQDAWPFFPDDLDKSYFNVAPEDQQIDGYFTGNEPLEINHMHPEKPHIKSRLPGLRSRCFIKRTNRDGKNIFQEVRTYIETVWLFPGAGVGLALHRGVSKIEDDEAEDVSCLLAAWEPLDEERKPIEYYEELLERETAVVPPEEEPEPVEEMEDDAVPAKVTAGPEVEAPVVPEVVEQSEPDPMEQEMERGAMRARAKIRAALRFHGFNPDDFLNRSHPDNALSPDEIERKMLSVAEKNMDGIRTIVRNEGLDVAEVFDKPFSSTPAGNPDALIAHLRKFAPPSVQADLPAMEADIRELAAEQERLLARRRALEEAPEQPTMREKVIAGAGERKSFSGWDLSGLDLSKLDLSGLDFTKADLTNSNLSGSNLSRADLAGAKASKADFSKANLNQATLQNLEASNANFSESDLTEVALAGAVVDGAEFKKARLGRVKMNNVSAVETLFSEADLTGAEATLADFSQADFTGARLQSAVLSDIGAPKAAFTGADLSGADLSRAILSESDFTGADLSQATMVSADLGLALLRQANLKEADLTDADASGADLTQAHVVTAVMERAVLQGCIMQKADLTDCRAANACLIEADCRDVCFKNADLTQTDLSKALLDNADFSLAKARNINVIGAVGLKTKFNKSDLSGIRAGKGTRLTETDFTLAGMESACMAGADLSGSDFSEAALTGADFTGSRLEQAKLPRIDARGAVFIKADLSGADLSGADMFQGNFRKARLVNTDFRGASLFNSNFFRCVLGNTNFTGANLKQTLLAEWRPE